MPFIHDCVADTNTRFYSLQLVNAALRRDNYPTMRITQVRCRAKRWPLPSADRLLPLQNFNFARAGVADTGKIIPAKVSGWAMKRLLKPLRYKRTDKLRDVIREHDGGIHKRIDENRELLETLQDSIPEFIAANPWIEDWLEAQDSFLGRIAEAARLPAEKKIEPNPRPWPGRRRGRRSSSPEMITKHR